MGEALYITNTASSSISTTGSDVVLITGNIKPNQYNDIMVSSHIEVTTAVASATTNNTIKVKIGATTVKTVTFKTDGAVRTLPMRIEWIGDGSQGGAVSITVAGAGVDANTTWIARDLYVVSMQ